MRPIKFRVWTGFSMEHQILVGALGAFYAPGLDPQDTACICKNNTIYSKECPVMQFTGLLDKSGKEIYEGDVLKWVYHDEGGDGAPLINENTFEIKWVQQYCGFNLAEYPPLDSHSEIEILGNIYENPNLLDPTQRNI